MPFNCPTLLSKTPSHRALRLSSYLAQVRQRRARPRATRRPFSQSHLQRVSSPPIPSSNFISKANPASSASIQPQSSSLGPARESTVRISKTPSKSTFTKYQASDSAPKSKPSNPELEGSLSAIRDAIQRKASRRVKTAEVSDIRAPWLEPPTPSASEQKVPTSPSPITQSPQTPTPQNEPIFRIRKHATRTDTLNLIHAQKTLQPPKVNTAIPYRTHHAGPNFRKFIVNTHRNPQQIDFFRRRRQVAVHKHAYGDVERIRELSRTPFPSLRQLRSSPDWEVYGLRAETIVPIAVHKPQATKIDPDQERMSDPTQNPSQIHGHATYIAGAAKSALGYTEAGEADKDYAVKEMRAAKEQAEGEPNKNETVGKVEEKLGSVTGCEGMVGEGKERQA